MGERDTVAGRKAGRRGRCFPKATSERAAPKDRPPLFLKGGDQCRWAGPSLWLRASGREAETHQTLALAQPSVALTGLDNEP